MIAQDYFVYLVKVTGISGLLFGYYLLALRNKKFHRYNRFYLLASLLLSLIVPLLQFNWFSIKEQMPIYESTKVVYSFIPSIDKAEAPIRINLWSYGLMAFLLISVLLLCVLLFRIIRIYQLKNKQRKTVMDGFCMIETELEDAPFSFLQNLFWRKNIDLETEEGQQILTHELTHIKEKHTIDRLFCQVVTSLFWVNPFFWMIHKELETVHEFLADEQAAKNADGDAFARMLLTAHFGNRFMAPTHTFFYASVKRRLTMLTASKNVKYSYVRRLMVIPLILFLMALFSFTLEQTVQGKSLENKDLLIVNIVDTAKRGASIRAKPNVTQSKGNARVKTLIASTVNDTVPEVKTEATIRRYRDFVIVVDGKLQDGGGEELLRNMSAGSIKRFWILKGDSAAVKTYGPRAEKGVLAVETYIVADTIETFDGREYRTIPLK